MNSYQTSHVQGLNRLCMICLKCNLVHYVIVKVSGMVIHKKTRMIKFIYCGSSCMIVHSSVCNQIY